VQYRKMDNSQNNGASTPPAEEQVPRVEETATSGNPLEGNPSGASTASRQVQPQTVKDTAQGDSATPVETGTRQRIDAEKQRAAKVNRERQQRLLRDAPKSSTDARAQA
jgi:hypothetical protein